MWHWNVNPQTTYQYTEPSVNVKPPMIESKHQKNVFLCTALLSKEGNKLVMWQKRLYIFDRQHTFCEFKCANQKWPECGQLCMWQFTSLTIENYIVKTHKKCFKNFKRGFTWIFKQPNFDIWPIRMVKTFVSWFKNLLKMYQKIWSLYKIKFWL